MICPTCGCDNDHSEPRKSCAEAQSLALALLVAQTLGDWKPDQLAAYGLDAIYEQAVALTEPPCEPSV